MTAHLRVPALARIVLYLLLVQLMLLHTPCHLLLQVKQGEEVGALESVKAASEVYSPVSGTVLGSNPGVEDRPGVLNKSAEGEGWLFRLELSDTSELEGLMDGEGYRKYLSSQTEDLEGV